MTPRLVYPHGDRGDLGVLMLDEFGAPVVRWRSGEQDTARTDGGKWVADIAGQWTRLHRTRRPDVTVDEVLADHDEAAEAVAAALDGVV